MRLFGVRCGRFIYRVGKGVCDNCVLYVELSSEQVVVQCIRLE